jgi:hypothetical protein
MFLLANGPAITIFDVIIITISIFKNFKHLEFYLKYTGLIVKYKNIFLLILILIEYLNLTMNPRVESN